MAMKTKMRSQNRVCISMTPDRYRAGSKYPGRYCKKRSVDMTDEESIQHHIYIKAKNKWVREHQGKEQKIRIAANHNALKRLSYTALSDWYIKDLIHTAIKSKVYLSFKIIEAKRQQIKLWRMAHGKIKITETRDTDGTYSRRSIDCIV